MTLPICLFLAFCLLAPIQSWSKSSTADGLRTGIVHAHHHYHHHQQQQQQLISRTKNGSPNLSKMVGANENGGEKEKEDKEQQRPQREQLVRQFVAQLIDQYNTMGEELQRYIDEDNDQSVQVNNANSGNCWQKISVNANELVDAIINNNNNNNIHWQSHLGKADQKKENVGQILCKKVVHLNSIDQLEEMADLLNKLHKSINVLIGSFNNDGISLKENFENLKGQIVEGAIMLATEWNIPINEIMPQEKGQKIEDKNMLEELAQLWHHYKSGTEDGNGQKSEENREKNGKRNKRMLQLIMDFSVDGPAHALAQAKSPKTSGRRRRRKRDDAKTIAIAIFAIVLALIALYSGQHYFKKLFNSKSSNANHSDIEAAEQRHQHMEPEPRERAVPRRHRDGNRRSRSRPSRQNSRSREALHHFEHSSSRGDPGHGHGNAEQFMVDQMYYSTPTHHAVQPANGVAPRDSLYFGDREEFERNNLPRGRSNGRRVRYPSQSQSYYTGPYESE